MLRSEITLAYPGTLNPMTSVVIGGRRREGAQRDGGKVTTEAERGEMPPKAKDAGGRWRQEETREDPSRAFSGCSSKTS